MSGFTRFRSRISRSVASSFHHIPGLLLDDGFHCQPPVLFCCSLFICFLFFKTVELGLEPKSTRIKIWCTNQLYYSTIDLPIIHFQYSFVMSATPRMMMMRENVIPIEIPCWPIMLHRREILMRTMHVNKIYCNMSRIISCGSFVVYGIIPHILRMSN